jgi:hypothetical protein
MGSGEASGGSPAITGGGLTAGGAAPGGSAGSGGSPATLGGSATAGAAASGGATQGGTNAGSGGAGCAGLLCEDFEQGQLDSAKWDLKVLGGATVVVEGARAAHGKYAAQVHALGKPSGGSSSAYAYLITKSAPAELATHSFGRAYFSTLPAPHSNNIGLIFGGSSGFPKPTYLSIAEHGGGWQWGFIKLDGAPSGERQAYSPSLIPAMKWGCLEWEFNDQPDQIKVWLDGISLGSFDAQHVDYPAGHVPGDPIFNNMSSGLVGGMTDFGFGVYDWHPGGFDFDFFYDDIVLGTSRVGCL